MMDDLFKKRGAFKISEALVKDNPAEVFIIMRNFIITRAEFCCMTRSFEYRAYSHLFKKVGEGCMIPHYTIQVIDGEVKAVSDEN